MVSLKEHIKTLVKLDLTAGILMHGANKLIASLSTSRNMLKPGTGKYFKWKYGDVFYHKIGEGAPLILIHDLDPASSSYQWSDVIDELSVNHTVYYVDLPGCGRSAKPKLTYTNYFYVLFLKDFIRTVVKKKADIVAKGYSSSFCLMLLALEPELIHHIYAVNPQSIGKLARTETRKSRVAKELISLPVLGTSLYNMEESHRNIDFRFTEEYLYNPFRSSDRFVDAFYEGAHYRDSVGKYLLASIKGLYMTVNIRKALKACGDKMTIIYGEGLDYAKDIIKEYQAIDPAIKAYPVAKAKILPEMECPKDFLKTLKKI